MFFAARINGEGGSIVIAGLVKLTTMCASGPTDGTDGRTLTSGKQVELVHTQGLQAECAVASAIPSGFGPAMRRVPGKSESCRS